MVSIGGCVFLGCDNKYAGSILFSVVLLSICHLSFYLYTGKIGYLTEDTSINNIKNLCTGLTMNLITTYLLGLLIRHAIPTLAEKATEICISKLNQSFVSTLVRSAFCGVLMYVAVQIYREKKSVLGIVYCIPVFILSGFEHSIADMFYFGVSGIIDAKIILFELAAVIGNSIGSIVFSSLTKLQNM